MAYSVIKEIGRGGFGVVELVQDERGQFFARKTLVVPPSLDAGQVTPRFEREVKYQSALNHENVVQILDYDLDANPPWFVMPLAEGSLLDELKADRTLGGDPKKALFDILAGLEEIHRRGYCHRDLKPGNVLRYEDADGSSRYALSDFGLMAIGEDASSTLTPSGVGGGTPLYQAPECAINFKRATSRSDIYSFGAMLHDIFAANPKRLPHDELSVPGDVGPIVEKCTKRNAHRRYGKVEELREDLFEALTGFEFVFESGEEEFVVGLLTANEFPSEEQWDRIFAFLDDQEGNLRAVANVFRALRREHIEQLNDGQIDLLLALGKQFADYCRNHAFDFDYCDVLAGKAQVFYDLGDTQLKASIAVAMLELGTSHNRWFVERKFMQMARTEISDALAERIVVELDVLGMNFQQKFDHLEHSIEANKFSLHPILQARLQA